MTTIAVLNGVVAADTQGSDHNMTVRIQKVWRLPDGGVGAGCGSWASAYAGLKWLMEGEKGEPPDIEGATVIVVRPDSSIWLAESRFPLFPLMDRYYADGCGRDMARLLLSQGKEPVQVVAEVCELDLLSSAPILSMTVIPTPEHVGPDYYETQAVGRKRRAKR